MAATISKDFYPEVFKRLERVIRECQHEGLIGHSKEEIKSFIIRFVEED